MFENIKPIKCFYKAEKAAIFAIKSCVFMQYQPTGTDIGLKFANEARKLCPDEMEWTFIWLKAKGKYRRFYHKYKLPDDDELEMSRQMIKTKIEPRFLVLAARLHKEAASIYRNNFKRYDANYYYKIAADIM